MNNCLVTVLKRTQYQNICSCIIMLLCMKATKNKNKIERYTRMCLHFNSDLFVIEDSLKDEQMLLLFVSSRGYTNYYLLPGFSRSNNSIEQIHIEQQLRIKQEDLYMLILCILVSFISKINDRTRQTLRHTFSEPV